MGWDRKSDIRMECEETEAECLNKANALMNPPPRLRGRWDQAERCQDQAPGASSTKTSQQGTHQVHARHMPAHARHMPAACNTHPAHD